MFVVLLCVGLALVCFVMLCVRFVAGLRFAVLWFVFAFVLCVYFVIVLFVWVFVLFGWCILILCC